jgi:ssRNA-specific RNase YbeY (16S rRNA maturation enzyme)
METEIPPEETDRPSLDIILDNPAPALEPLEMIIRSTIIDPVEFVICDPGVMRFLNLRWRHIDRSTDVLTFDLSSPDEDCSRGVVYIDGRLAPPLSEVLERIYHGLLHLQGMTHDTEEDAEEMNSVVTDLVTKALRLVESL